MKQQATREIKRKLNGKDEPEIESLIKQLNSMAVDDPGYAALVFRALNSPEPRRDPQFFSHGLLLTCQTDLRPGPLEGTCQMKTRTGVLGVEQEGTE